MIPTWGWDWGKKIIINLEKKSNIIYSIQVCQDEINSIINELKGIDNSFYYPEYQLWIIENELYDSNINRISPEKVEVKELESGYFYWEEINPGVAWVTTYRYTEHATLI